MALTKREQTISWVVGAAVGLLVVYYAVNAFYLAPLAEKEKQIAAAQKKANEARKKQKTVEVKEIKMRPNIDTHDYEVKMKSMLRFFEEGDKVKVTLRFRGREMAHQELGMALLHKVRDQVEPIAKVEAHPRLEGRQMVMVLAPK